ncbi:MAG: trimethylamine methyltransferase family protein [Desulfotignum sp.]|nr:trimethylamine methyltransferase family protein [Desulfotignum sp.]MCF8086740.1 trimethylamine methyltransferase family protein [Desulfotignum sp.]MCF8136494.1 trimethylamine methyltransferase family protein [Desulfotignum sp.]
MDFIDILTPEQVEQIHENAFKILEKTGCRIDHLETLERLLQAGATVDNEKKRAWFSSELIEQAIEQVPKAYRAEGRTPEADYEVYSGMEPRFRCLGGALKWLSLAENDTRPITGSEAKKMLTLADALPNIDLVGTPFLSDCPTPTYDIHSFRMALSGTTKHIWSLTTSSENLRYQMELLELAGGGKKYLETHKRVSGIVTLIDPLRFPGDEIERLKIYGEYKVPVKWTSSSMIGGNAPYTIAGTLVQNLAQFLASLVITRTMAPDTPVVYYTTLQVMDMRRGYAAFTAPELMMARAAIAQIGRKYQIPTGVTTLHSTGTEQEQGIFQRNMGLFNCMMAGASEINLCGSLDGGSFFSPEFAVIDNECISYLRRFRAGFDISDETMGLDAISRSVESGQYLSDPHTIFHLRREIHFTSDLFDLKNHASWLDSGGRSLVHKAWEKALSIMENHDVPPLDEKLEAELDRVVALADKKRLN